MKITIENCIIQKADLVKNDYGMELKLDFKGEVDDLFIIGVDSSFMEKIFELLKKSSLSEVKDIPIRIIGVESEDDEEVLELIAIGDFLEDKWLPLDEFSEGKITSFCEMFEEDVEIFVVV